MKKGCGLILAVWVLLVGAYACAAWSRVHQVVPVVIIAVLGGTFAAALVGSFTGLLTGARDRAALNRAIEGTAPTDGRLEAVFGPIRAGGAPLEAPFTGRLCVAYEYDVKPFEGGQSDFAGVALAPCVVDTPRGGVRMLGWALLDQFPPAPADAIDSVRGASYLQAVTAEPLGVTGFVSVLGELLADDDGSIRKDFRIGGKAVDLEGRAVEERIVPVGAAVTLIGRWSAARHGFAPAGTASMNRLFARDLLATRTHLSGASLKTFAIGLFFFLALHAILVPMYFLAPGK